MYKLQEQIRNNTNDINSTVSDLVNWTNEITTKEKKGVHKQSATNQKLPPIRNKIDITQSIKQNA